MKSGIKISCSVFESQGQLFICIFSEDRKLLRICLPKTLSGANKCWQSLLKDQYVADPFTYDQMEQKLTLQRYQYEVRIEDSSAK